MERTLDKTENSRDVIHNLDPIEHQEFIRREMADFIGDAEGFRDKVYNDNPKDPENGNDTIGFGFNMDQPGAREMWETFLPDVSFDDAKAGKIRITRDQGKLLMTDMITAKICRASQDSDPKIGRIKHFGSEFHFLRPNIQLFIADHYYHGDTFIMPGGKGYSDLQNYINTGDYKYVEALIEKIKNKPLNPKAPGIKVRDQHRIAMLNSADAPLPADPIGSGIPNGKSMKAKIKDTVVPRGMLEKYPTTRNHEKYFVWRTMLDGKVRKEHRELEGKIFPKGYTAENPFNCRCDEEAVPGNVIIEKTDSEKAMEAELWRVHYNVLKLKALFERDAA